MARTVSLWVLLIAAACALPSTGHASVAVVQDSCIQFEEGTERFIRVFFSVVNFNSANPICDLHFIPEGAPPDSQCIMVDCSTPSGWSCSLRSDGGADYIATSPGDCITAGHVRREFTFLLDPEFCCYLVQFTNIEGQVFAEQEECFTCVAVGVEPRNWGNVKRLYR